jgi:Arc/MetJ-type ribon-helix-helix transcriptional regulator
MVLKQIELTEEQNQTLEEMAGARGRSVSELVREGIELVIRVEGHPDREELKRRALQLSGRFRSGFQDLSTEHNRYLEEATKTTSTTRGRVPIDVSFLRKRWLSRAVAFDRDLSEQGFELPEQSFGGLLAGRASDSVVDESFSPI